MEQEKLKQIEIFATKIRIEVAKEFRQRTFGHVGGCMSVVDALAVLYGDILNVDPKNLDAKDRDRLVMSKGHAGPALYATLALKEFFPIHWLNTLNVPGTNLPSHCDHQKTPGIDATTGSLGQGASQAAGLALGLKNDSLPASVYLFLGDGELNEGQVWESALFAAHFKLHNLIAFVDNNGKQLDGRLEDVMDMGNIEEKFKAFNWHTQTIDGHDLGAIYQAIKNAQQETSKPSCIILKTIKGKGIPEIETMEMNHHVVFPLELANKAIERLEKRLKELEQGVISC